MFAHVVRPGVWQLEVHRIPYVIGAAAFQALLGVALVAASAWLAADVARAPLVEVRLVRAAPPRPPPPPPPPPPKRAGGGAPRAQVASKPVPRKPPAPTAIFQPREIAPVLVTATAPGAADGAEAGGGEAEGEEGGVEGGVVGGVVGGVIGGVVGGVLPGASALPRGAAEEIEEAPQYATGGFRRPAEARPGCVRELVRLPPELAGFVSGLISVRFAVARDGSVGLVELLTPGGDPRVEQAIRRAVLACRFVPGADAQGRPVRLWVVMPVRFTSG
ncbi:energy transducer TonB [Anaeromyxobacter paludicola]|uniref:TonB C-terminal domain-containing protein n=1 Tax=Anaeromyxobacter paludicola TaxID=2918171 RepID=A0ABN6NDW5_9BACT|nr:energy transducer TonB [Anaeromyxobacter paludicola]BDG10696.1 hypothetical protein AMPC_38090 [Anaeromyxobacter paludicola]